MPISARMAAVLAKVDAEREAYFARRQAKGRADKARAAKTNRALATARRTARAVAAKQARRPARG